MLNDYQLFLFDFDGLLVDTEVIHYKAYKTLFDLPCSFEEYASYALNSAEGPRNLVIKYHPEVADQPWEPLYEQKCQRYVELLGSVELMPGAQELLEELAKRDQKRCVVTHSRQEHVDLVRSQHPILNTIPHWITRRDYSKPKPDPQSYALAMERYLGPEERAIGFEDSPRGLAALYASGATAVMVGPIAPELEGALHLPALTHLL